MATALGVVVNAASKPMPGGQPFVHDTQFARKPALGHKIRISGGQRFENVYGIRGHQSEPRLESSTVLWCL
ncbi:MAG TPA: hypothetical protein VF550_03330 [Polyangia bacterium]